MNLIADLFTNYYFLSFIIAWLIAVILKAILKSIKSGGFNILYAIKNGGMPSSHSTAVSAICSAIFLKTGLSSLFFVTLVFALIVISDSFSLRKSVGEQGEKINKLLSRNKEKPIEVIYGHTLIQSLVGIIIGFSVALILFFLI